MSENNNKEKNGYEEKIVCFIKIMGMKNRIDNSESYIDLQTVYGIEKQFVDNPSVERDSLNLAVFTDCMYIVADRECIDHVFGFIAKLAYNFLVNAKCNLEVKEGQTDIYDCIKVRGGITYGDVLIPYKEKSSKMSNVFSGPAIKAAYILESQEAVYPRVIVDKEILENLECSKDKEYLVCDDENDYYYLDFLKYIGKKGLDRSWEIGKYVDFVNSEMEDASKCADDKLTEKLSWYKSYLERYI